MNKIQKYQTSIYNFLEKKTVLLELIKKNSFFLTIFLMTLSNNINKKNRNHQHGYYIGSSIELILLLLRSLEKKHLFDVSNIDIIKIISLTNILLSQNLNLASNVLSKDKLLKNYNISFNNLNQKIISILDNVKFDSIHIIETDFFILKNDKIILKNFIRLNKDDLIKYIENKYCVILELATNFTWNLGGGNENIIIHIQKLGYYYAFLLKFYYDLKELKDDFNNKIENYYPNIIINLGIHPSFEFYYFYKKKFIELSIKLNIYSNTIKELLDEIENEFDKFIENCNDIL